ncbi:MAG: SGNH/GDSL hydrolase family protein [Planctomycetota bacterium]|nr:SGNH/GDSL hydrolase family protein [Planctomycetota bacterium]
MTNLKKLVLILSLLLSCTASLGLAQTVDDLSGKRIVFLGDSITQNGTYVSHIQYFLEKSNPNETFDILGLGLSSETLSGLSEPNHAGGRFPRPCLFERLGRLLEKAHPDIVFACYGMNDGIYMPLNEERFGAFKKGVLDLLEACQVSGVERIFLITPPIYDLPLDAGGFNYDSVLTYYAEWEQSQQQDRVHVIDLHTTMRAARATRDTPFSRDRVHPGEEGHWVIAQAVLRDLGLEPGLTGLADMKADPLYQAVAELRQHRSKSWMSHIGYTREKTVAPTPLSDTLEKEKSLRERIEVLKRQ